MAGRAAIVWAGAWTLGVALLAGPRLAADEPVRPPSMLSVEVPPLPAETKPVPAKPAPEPVAPKRVVAFQRPPEPPTVPPVDPFQEPPISPFLQQPPIESEAILPDGSRVNLPTSSRQVIRFSPRYGQYSTKRELLGEGVQRWLITGGVIVNVIYQEAGQPREVEFSTDNAVAWIRGRKDQPNRPEIQAGTAEDGQKTEVELYLSGNVVIRSLTADPGGARTVEQVLRAREIYYDVTNNRAIAMQGDIELRVPNVPDSIHVRGREIWQLGKNEWRLLDVETSSSKRPSDPSMRLLSDSATLVQRNAIRRNVFGRPYRDLRTGELDYGYERILTSERSRLRLYDYPVAWFGRTRTNIDDPVGPLAGLTFGNSNVLGMQAFATWDLYNLLALRPPPGHTWLLHTDYMSDRGPALGTEYDYTGPNFLGFGGYTVGSFLAYGIHDQGIDDLGGDRGPEPEQPEFRGRVRWQHNQELYESGTTYLRALAQVSYLSDKNFFEQYYKFQFDTQPNQETFLHLPWAIGNLGGSFLTQGNFHRDWVTETEWWPRADGYLIGQSLFRDRLVYSARGDVGYAGLRPAEIEPLPIVPTDRRVDTGRFHLNQRLSAPFDLGPLRLDPYGVVDLAHYTEDLTGESRGRLYGAGGARASLSFSKLYPDVVSELFNLKGLYHKVTLGANYYAARSDTPYTDLPQLDRLNDDVTDFNDRLYRPRQVNTVPGPEGVALATSPLFDPQRYAIRRLVDNKYDTLDTVEVLQLEARQRWQTKRGFPGNEHVVDWLAANVSVSLFPNAERDNFGEDYAFLEGNLLWHVGDRTSLSAAAWYDPFDPGARYFNLGASFDRPDGSTFYASYHYTDPINSRLLIAGVNYQLSRKYTMNMLASYDVGVDESLSNRISFARIGSDLTVMIGVSYNSIVKNFGFQFAIVPNLTGVTPAQLAYGSAYGTGRRRQ